MPLGHALAIAALLAFTGFTVAETTESPSVPFGPEAPLSANAAVDLTHAQPTEDQSEATQSDSHPTAATGVAIPRREPHAVTTEVEKPWYRSTFIALGAVVVLIIALASLAKRYVMPTQSTGADVLRVLCRTSLSPKHTVALVQIGRGFAFVGLAPEAMTLLRTVVDDDEAALLRKQFRLQPEEKKSPTEFDRALAGRSQREEPPLERPLTVGAEADTPVNEPREEVKNLLHRLREFKQASKRDKRSKAPSRAA